MKIFGYTIPQVGKALVGFVTPGVIALGVAFSDESAGGSTVTSTEWVGVMLAMLATGGLVFGVKNAPRDPQPTA